MNAPEKGYRETYLFEYRSIFPFSSKNFQSKAYSQNHLSHNMCSQNLFQTKTQFHEGYRQKIRVIPPKANAGQLRVGIYCRVSTKSPEQLRSLSSQVSGLIRKVSENERWRLCDAFVDICSAKTDSHLPEYERMIAECESHHLDIIICKSISRFGRDTLETLNTVRRLRAARVLVIDESGKHRKSTIAIQKIKHRLRQH